MPVRGPADASHAHAAQATLCRCGRSRRGTATLNCSGCSCGARAMAGEQRCCGDLVALAAPQHGTGHCGCLSSAGFSGSGFLKGKSLLVQGVCLTHINSQL